MCVEKDESKPIEGNNKTIYVVNYGNPYENQLQKWWRVFQHRVFWPARNEHLAPWCKITTRSKGRSCMRTQATIATNTRKTCMENNIMSTHTPGGNQLRWRSIMSNLAALVPFKLVGHAIMCWVHSSGMSRGKDVCNLYMYVPLLCILYERNAHALGLKNHH
jgi:hypothetical protein